MGGGTKPCRAACPRLSGLSPRGRGNLIISVLIGSGVRSIPAWAGEPVVLTLKVLSKAVYPRVGGGTGLHVTDRAKSEGLSPRGRGNPPCDRTRWHWIRVYPRVGGETLLFPAFTDRHLGLSPRVNGLSPRGRGNPA